MNVQEIAVQNWFNAVLDNDAAQIENLLAAGDIDVNHPFNNIGMTALAHASDMGHLETVQVLLAADGIDVNHESVQGWTALMLASRHGHTDTVLVLALGVLGIDVNKRNSGGWTALIFASWHGHTDIVRILLDAPGIDVNLQDDLGLTPLMWAAGRGGRGGDTEMVQLLLADPRILDGVNLQDNNDWTALRWARFLKEMEIVQLLQEAGAVEAV